MDLRDDDNSGDGIALRPLLEEMADVCRVKHFPRSDDLRTTLWKNLPPLARALGKTRFKRNYLQVFLNLLMENLDERRETSQLSIHAAGQCADELSVLVGVGIFRGRLEEDWQRDAFDRVMLQRRNARDVEDESTKCPINDGFSPYGPSGNYISPASKRENGFLTASTEI